MKSRLILVSVALALWSTGIVARLYQLQVVDHEIYRQRAVFGQHLEKHLCANERKFVAAISVDKFVVTVLRILSEDRIRIFFGACCLLDFCRGAFVRVENLL